MLLAKDVDQILQHPEVQEQTAKLQEMNAPWERIQLQAVDTAAVKAISKDDAFRIILKFLVDAVNDWEERRNPKTRTGRFLKFIFGLFGSK